MKITMYELLGMVKDEPDRSIYVKYFDRLNKKEAVMWACKENIIYKLEQLIIELNDEVEILEEEKKIPEKIKSNGKEFYCDNIDSWIDKEETSAYCEYLMNKYNEIIDYLGYLKSKGDE